jgi:hypothetical protein
VWAVSLLSEGVIELFHRDLAVSVSVEVSDEGVGLLVSHVNVQMAKTSGELLEVDEFVTVTVEFGKEVNTEGLEGLEFRGWGLDLSDNGAEGGFGEHITVIFHVLFSVLISGGEHKLEASKGDSAANHEITLSVVAAGNGGVLLLALHEATTNTSRVLVTDFVDLDGVVTAVERDDEGTGLIIGLSADELGVESEDMHVLLEHLLHVILWWLRLQGNNWGHWVLRGTVAGLWGHSLVEDLGVTLGEGKRLLFDVEVSPVPWSGEIIRVVDKTLASPDSDDISDEEVLRAVVLDVLQVKAGVMSEDRGHSELLTSKEHGEGVLAVVRLDDFLDLNGVVGEEVVATVVLVATIVTVVLPHNSEGEHLAVIIEERLEVLVGATTLKHHFDVVLVFSQIWGVLLHVDHGAGVHKRIIGKSFAAAKGDTFVSVERASELVAVNNAEDTTVEVNISTNLEIAPSEGIDWVKLRDEVTLKENALGDSWVLDAGLKDVNSVIFEIVIDGALA